MEAIEATVIAAHGRHYKIETDSQAIWPAIAASRNLQFACADRARVLLPPGGPAQLIEQLPRRSVLYRSDLWKQKIIAANVTQILAVVATEPAFSDEMLTRTLVAAESENLRALIVLNKMDLSRLRAPAQAQLAPFADLGYPIVEISAQENAQTLLPYLDGQLSVLVGQSGMGKSTLVNALVPDARSRTQEISTALGTGKHTTTHAQLYRLSPGIPGGKAWSNSSALIDSPGLQAFGLAHLTTGALEAAFSEFRPLLGLCRFRNCTHRHEPGCAIVDAVEAGQIHPRRHAHFLRLCQDSATGHPHG
jgi:ribosome biogenesis GTPase